MIGGSNILKNKSSSNATRSKSMCGTDILTMMPAAAPTSIHPAASGRLFQKLVSSMLLMIDLTIPHVINMVAIISRMVGSMTFSSSRGHRTE